MVSLAEPLNDGAVLLDGDFTGSNVTVGEVVSTTNVTGELVPAGFPSELVWLATAVYVCFPLARLGFALPEVQLPPVDVAVALETSEFEAS